MKGGVNNGYSSDYHDCYMVYIIGNFNGRTRYAENGKQFSVGYVVFPCLEWWFALVGRVFRMTEAQTKLVEDNLKLVFEVLNRKYPWLAYDEDVISVGNLGLCKAAMNFDPERGFAFSTFAWPVIHNEIKMHLRKDLKIKANEIPPDFLRSDAPEEDDCGDGNVFEIRPCEEPGFESVEFSKDLENAMSDLTENQRRIVEGVARRKSYVQIGKEMGTSKQYVQQEFRKVARVIAERMKGYD